MMEKRNCPGVLFNVRVDEFQTESAILAVEELWQQPSASALYFVNAHCFNIAQKDQEYHRILENSAIVLNDGSGIAIAGKMAGRPFPENMNGTDFIPMLIAAAHEKKYAVYVLGGIQEVSDAVREKARRQFPGLVIDSHNGYFDDIEESDILEALHKANVKLLVIGMGVPRQEKWIAQNLHCLPPGCVAVAGGGFVDFYAERFARAPLWARKAGVEWLWRLAQEPGRLWKRYVVGNFSFLFRCMRLRLTMKKNK
ncbi:MAG: WecB/TagA/CpsF family glycosyltransferase [Oscillospiraceae bacterium]